MDPTACLRRFFDAFVDDDTEEMLAASGDLHNWLRRGGFAPEMSQADHRELWATLRGLCRTAHASQPQS